MPQDSSQELLQGWRESAGYWAKHAATVRSIFAPITDALIKASEIKEGQTILDVAGGVGEPSFTIARTLSPRGYVVFTDAIFEMALSSKLESARQNLANIDFAQCIGEAIPFRSKSFDAVVSRLGIMLFSDPLASLKEMLRVTRSAGRIALAVWHTQDSNPFFHVVANVVSRYVASPPSDPDAPGAFRFAEEGKLDRLLTEAGAIDASSFLLEFELRAEVTPLEFWRLRTDLSETLRGKLASLSPDQLNRLAKEVEEAAEAFYKGGSMTFPAKVWIVTGVKI